MPQWKSIWGQSHVDIGFLSPTYKDNTMRISVRNAVSGNQVRLRVSNLEGKKSYCISEAAVSGQRGEPKTVLFQGKPSVDLQPGEERFSDPAELPIADGELITVSLSFNGAVRSGNNISEHVQCSRQGNFVKAAQFKTVHRNRTASYHDLDAVIPALSSVEVITEDDKEVIVCFGDSITQMSRWTKPLAKQLANTAIVINKGIGGNRLLSGPFMKMMAMYGRSGLDRFDRDVLNETGATAVILSIGTNDIGMVRKEAEMKSFGADALASAYTLLSETARSHGLKVYATTILPRMGTTGYLDFQEKERLAFNRWIRSSKLFDAVFDFDAAVRDSKHPEMMAFPYDSGDHLHPSALGGEKLADCVTATLKL